MAKKNSNFDKLLKKGEKVLASKAKKPKKVFRKSTRATLDLRQKEVKPLKQHGFKEMEIENTNFLFN